MNICIMVVNTIRIIVKTVIQVVREIVTTVCKLVTTVIRTVKEVVQKICTWLPWPLDKLCDLVTKLIEVVETITQWVCEEVIQTILDWVEAFIEYVFYILTWVCWLVSWIIRIFDLLFCWIGIKPTKYIHVCVKILTDDEGNPAMSVEKVRTLLNEAQSRFEQCKIKLCVMDISLVKKPEYLTDVDCGFGALFSGHHLWFTDNQCTGGLGSSIVPVTVYVIEDLNTTKGCAIPNTHYVVLDREASNATMAHEIGHLADLWKHSSDPDNVMYTPTTDASVNFTGNQCCLIRSSRYATLSSYFGCSSKDLKSRVLSSSGGCCGKSKGE